jgi:hypothetical protein
MMPVGNPSATSNMPNDKYLNERCNHRHDVAHSVMSLTQPRMWRGGGCFAAKTYTAATDHTKKRFERQ